MDEFFKYYFNRKKYGEPPRVDGRPRVTSPSLYNVMASTFQKGVGSWWLYHVTQVKTEHSHKKQVKRELPNMQ